MGTPYRRTFARLLGFLRPYRRGLIVSIVLAVGSQAAQIALIYVTGRKVIDKALSQQDTTSSGCSCSRSSCSGSPAPA